MNQLTEIQSCLCEMLEWFHDFCENHGLTYYAVGGTMLGAVRHNGFIPWDDDVDLAMPRPDYERFLSLTEGKNTGRYVTESMYSGKKDFTYLYAKIYDTQTTLVEHLRIPMKRGIFIDLFPIDGTGSNEAESYDFFKPVGNKMNFHATRACGIRKGRKLYKNMAVCFSRLLTPFLPDLQAEMRNIDNICKSKKYSECKFVANMYGLKRAGEIMPKEYFGSPILYNFENLKIYGVEMYDQYLTQLYGEWNKLPPKEEQITHHDFVMYDLHHSYLENKE